MFPFHSADPIIEGVLQGILELIRYIYNTMAPFSQDPESLGFFDAVLGLREFAGATWYDAAHGIAHGSAIVIDDLLDLCLRLLHLDPQVIRGDH